MNILILTNSLGIGGIERSSQVFAQYLNKVEGIRVIFGTKDPYGPRRDFLENDGIEIIDVTKMSPDEIASKYKIEVIFAHCYNTHEFKKFKDIIKIQEVIFAGCYDKHADINLSISDALSYKVKLMNPEAKVITLYYPQDNNRVKIIKDSADLKRKFGFKQNDFIIGRVGRAEPSKLDYLFIPSVKRALEKYDNVKLLLVGMPFLYKLYLCRYRKRIKYIKQTADDKKLAEVYNCMDVFFHTAERGETFGNVIAEAMSFGKPVITHSTHFQSYSGEILLVVDNSQTELIQDGVNGFIANNPKKICNDIGKLIQSHDLYENISKNNIEKVASLYDAKIIIGRFMEIIKEYKNSKIIFEDTQILKNKYNERIENVNTKQSTRYKINKKVFDIIKIIYLSIRKILRKIGYDIEYI